MSTNLTALFTASVQDRADPSSRSTQFVPVEGGAPQATDAGTFMVAAYVLMWLCTVIFIVHTWRKTRSVENRVSELQKAIAKLPQTED
jgi:hypothetical protein